MTRLTLTPFESNTMSSNENPFQYYESEPFNERPNRSNNPNSRYSYVDPAFITTFTLVFLIAAIVLDSAGAVARFGERALFHSIQSMAYETDEAMMAAANASDARVLLVGMLQTLVTIVSGIVFLFWTYRVCQNAHYLNMVSMTNTPGWAVGWYFIPIFNLWRPYLALREAFVASCHPEGEQSSGTTMIGIWWFVYIFSAFFGRIVFRMSLRIGDEPEMAELFTVNGLQIVGNIVGVLLSILTIVILLRFLRCQRETKEMIIVDDFV